MKLTHLYTIKLTCNDSAIAVIKCNAADALLEGQIKLLMFMQRHEDPIAMGFFSHDELLRS
jgi:predicted lipid carrier protein YhbT